MSLKIAVCDDTPADRQRLLSLIKAEEPCCEVAAYESGEVLLWDIESGARFDIFFLDIYLSGMSGVEAGKRIHDVDPEALLIFVSSSDNFYRESYDLYAFNYIVKPYTEKKLAEVLHNAMNRLNKNAQQVVRFSFNNSLNTVRCSQIVYLMSDQHVVNFHMINGEILKSYIKLEDCVMQLSAENFVRCHQSYIVNLKYVTGMTAGEFILGGTTIPVSRNYCAHAREKYRIQMFEDF